MRTNLLVPSFLLLTTCFVGCGGGGSSDPSGPSGNDAGVDADANPPPDASDEASEEGGATLCAAGVTESCYSGPEATLGVGLCAAGLRTCNEDGMSWGTCVGEVLPATETCNTPGDDDCDGEPNEDGPGCSCVAGEEVSCYSGPPSTKNVGPCKAGTQTCKPDGTGYGPCEGEVTPVAESCNTAIDDDCDGELNEEGDACVCVPDSQSSCFEGPAGTEGVGMCQAGLRTCNELGTAWGACEGQVLPETESCNTQGDDDCDGLTNEDGAGCSCVPGEEVSCYSGPPNTKNVGPCKAGTQACNADGTGYGPCVGETTPVAETCSTAIDDDCDGQINEDGVGCVCAPAASEACYSGPSGTADVGVCKSGTRVCSVQGTAWGACSGEVLPSAETCFTLADDDCDGFSNEEGAGCACVPGEQVSCYSGDPATEGVGPCHGGTQSCKSDGTGFGACSGEVTPLPETCTTAVDDDCDGATNEGGSGCVCTPNATSTCYTGPSGTLGVGICAAGTRTCNAQGTAWGACSGQVTPLAETCLTAADDDCDGLTNEEGDGCVCTPAEQVSCYSGANGTEGVGPCQAGTQTCKPDGTGYSACSGEVTPLPETCTTVVDDDCDGQVNEEGSGCVCLPLASESCYSGPTGTEGVGICKAGSRSCNSQGTAWGSCTGEVTPGLENCSTAADEDCDGATPACGAVNWAKRWGDSALQFATGIAADPSDNWFFTGGLYGTANFGGGNLTSTDDADVFLVKLTPAGDHVWSKRYGVSCGQQNATGVASDAQGNVIVTGYHDGSLNFGGTNLSGPSCFSGRHWTFVAKLDGSGNHIWSKLIRTESNQDSVRSRRVRVDAAGNIVIGGEFNGNVDLGAGYVSTGQPRGVFVASLDPDGNHRWSHVYGGSTSSAYSNVWGVGVDPAGNVAIAGTFSGDIDLGSGSLTSAANKDMFVARFDSSGTPQWSRRVGGSGEDWARDVTLDGLGNVLVSGHFDATVDFGFGPVTTTGYGDGYVVKYGPTGTPSWVSIITGSNSQFAMSVHADVSNQVIVGGHFYGASGFAGTTLTAPTTSPDLFLLKLTDSGAATWVQHFAGSGFEDIRDIASDSTRSIAIAGSIGATTTFGSTTLTPSGTDAFVAKLAP